MQAWQPVSSHRKCRDFRYALTRTYACFHNLFAHLFKYASSGSMSLNSAVNVSRDAASVNNYSALPIKMIPQSHFAVLHTTYLLFSRRTPLHQRHTLMLVPYTVESL